MLLALAIAVLAYGSPARAQPEPIVRVGLVRGGPVGECTVTVWAGASQVGSRHESDQDVTGLAGPEDSVLALGANEEARLAAAGDEVLLTVGDSPRRSMRRLVVTPRHGFAAIESGANGSHAYRGVLEFTASAGRLSVVNVVGLEGYLRSVAPAEMPRSFHREALAAQAIVARTYALRADGRHASAGFDLCDTTHCQEYRGTVSEAPETDAAVAATQSLVLAFGGEIAAVSYHSTCGGRTAAMWDVWGGALRAPYLSGANDQVDGAPACARSSQFWWSVELSRTDLARIAGQNGAGAIGFAVTRRSADGRAAEVAIEFGDGRQTMTGSEFYRRCAGVLGWGKVKSAWFDVSARNGGWHLTGRGAGHGVGLCQWGAQGRAQAGASAQEILEAYFPGTELRRYDELGG